MTMFVLLLLLPRDGALMVVFVAQSACDSLSKRDAYCWKRGVVPDEECELRDLLV